METCLREFGFRCAGSDGEAGTERKEICWRKNDTLL